MDGLTQNVARFLIRNKGDWFSSLCVSSLLKAERVEVYKAMDHLKDTYPEKFKMIYDTSRDRPGAGQSYFVFRYVGKGKSL